MIKKLLSKAMLLSTIAICSGVQEIKAQLESANRELKIVSFKEADEEDDDVRKKSSLFDKEEKLKTTALVKVFMPGEIESTDPKYEKIEYKPTKGGSPAYYVWIPQQSSSLRITPKGTYQTIKIEFDKYGIPKSTIVNKKGGLQARTVYHLTLRDPAPVYINTQLEGAYATVDDEKTRIDANEAGRIKLENLNPGEHTVYVFAKDGSPRGSVKINDSEKLYDLDARRKRIIEIRTNPAGGQIVIKDGESKEEYDSKKEYTYGSYKVIANINGNEVVENITVDDHHNSFTINNTRTYNITPMYMGSSTSADVYENNKQLEAGADNGVVLNGNTYQVTRPIGSSFKYYAANRNGKSPKTTINVNNNSQSDYQLSIAARNSFVWPWQREYEAAPMGVALGYVQKQRITKGEGEKLKENGVWDDGENKWLHGMQVGIYAQPCFSWGLGLYSGLFYEFYMSSNGNAGSDEWEDFQEHNIAIPVHALYRIPFGRKCALSLHGGLGFSYAISGAYKAEDYEDYTDFYGEEPYPKRFNMALEGGIDFRVGPVQIGVLYSKGLNDHGSYSSLGDYKTTYNKIGVNIAWVVGEW